MGLEPATSSVTGRFVTRRHSTPTNRPTSLDLVRQQSAGPLAPCSHGCCHVWNRAATSSCKSAFLAMERAGFEPATSGLQKRRFTACLRRDGASYADSVRLRRVRSVYSGTRFGTRFSIRRRDGSVLLARARSGWLDRSRRYRVAASAHLTVADSDLGTSRGTSSHGPSPMPESSLVRSARSASMFG